MTDGNDLAGNATARQVRMALVVLFSCGWSLAACEDKTCAEFEEACGNNPCCYGACITQTHYNSSGLLEGRTHRCLERPPADCTPHCLSSECGPDGCGGLCGVCALNTECDNGRCKQCSGAGCLDVADNGPLDPGEPDTGEDLIPPPDWGEDQGGETDVDPCLGDCSAKPYGFGCGCERMVDCVSFFCVLMPDDTRRCSATCFENCCEGWECQQPYIDGEPITVCIPYR